MSRSKGKFKKYQPYILLLVLGLFASPLIIKFWVEHQARTKEVVQRETGLALPSGVAIEDAQVQLFSLADGVNYDWLLSGSTSLIPWASSVGRDQIQAGAGWEKIETFQQICPFRNAAFEEVSLHSAWRIVNVLPDKEATSYLYIAEDEKTGLLSTFNP
ncbi:hypothetical protein [Candidatus Electrothrix sp.]|uniref:hypothetical protein n=1 Tax=Candidatus Electrothrix sp. TaxID=2170559 RepID=UPI004056E120